MRSQKLGKSISKVEVLNISTHGVWIYVNKKEYFLSYKEYPWFRHAKVAEIHNVKLLHGIHLHWPDLDVDIELESFEHPEKYPLIYR
tara:strand:- start:8 stop:268 length:261 start_codon:yes stop_codon:yes gene_type:complete